MLPHGHQGQAIGVLPRLCSDQQVLNIDVVCSGQGLRGGVAAPAAQSQTAPTHLHPASTLQQAAGTLKSL